ncbi:MULTISPECIES: ferredoxin-thioredoxin reductase catalytic domain-containing protein [unclassified Archaeoglobus]|jgi:ferredoxin-thioredoxin reductase catalytic subunit|uniref:ferredoxin-thioredoxin reductase catalytic domain-containing protein n=1 Tax=unclassified Archaeoglobus TaxID=2643606 RepID=UPI0025BD08B7|nr:MULTISPECIES: ferredoxin-thioredoxin reductase catalytic domain-containing protein [unclassified Archaeoglobus]
MEVEDYLRIFERVAEKRGWRVNPDTKLVKEFAKGLIENKKNYGMATCPCRLVTGKREIDKLIICPCVYAEEDIKEYGRCYCGLYLSKEKEPADSLPDRHVKYYLEP